MGIPGIAGRRRFNLISVAVISALCVVLLARIYFNTGIPDTAVGQSSPEYFDYLGDGSAAVSPIPQQVRLDPRKVALGARLFQEPLLSDSGVNCETCHALSQAGVDHLALSIDVQGGFDSMNTPTVFNAGFNQYQTWTGRIASLEEQIDDVINNPKHMNSSWPAVVRRLQAVADYRDQFARIYATGISAQTIQDALATFERSLITPDSAFDRYLRGDRQALGEQQRAGYRLFREYGCISCHQGVNLGGNVRAVFGVFANTVPDAASPGGGESVSVSPMPAARIFRVPSLRNVARTSPYFHDGSASSLAEAVKIMASYQLGRDIPVADIDLIVEFLKSLSGEYQGKPL